MSKPIPRLHTLPARFHSVETGAPFTHCHDCKQSLEACEDGFVVQKAYARGEVILELALCNDCNDKLQNSYSTESRDRIWNFYLDHADLPGRLRKFSAIPVGDEGPWIDHCMTCSTARASLDEYVVAAQVFEGDLVYGETPMMICSGCMDKIVEMLSEESRESYDRWMDRVSPAAPELEGDRPRVRIFM